MDESHFQTPDQTLTLKSKVASLAKSILDKQGHADRAAELLMSTASPTIERNLMALEGDLAALRADLYVAEGELKEATARLSPAEHMRRVMEVREALDHTDHTTRVAARQRVHEAMKSMVTQVTFLKTDQDERFIQIKLVGGLHSLIMNNDGAVIQRNVPSPTAKASDYVGYVLKDVAMIELVETYFRRRG
jgi:outer membrane PBP1 activator LpoA protein